MRLARSLEETAGFEPSAVTIGKFDGVHGGHRHLVRRVVGEAKRLGIAPTVLTFDRHPASVVAPDRVPAPLLPLEDRLTMLAEAGVEQILVLPFTPEVARLTPLEFATSCLRDALRARLVLVGENFRFGYKQSGDTRVLRELGQALGFEVEMVEPFRYRGDLVSTSRVRDAVSSGKIGLAGRLLGRPYALSGPVVRGQGIGSKQTVPTLNLDPPGLELPADGVYITRTCDLDSASRWNSITNVGMRPTFRGEARTIETFLLDPLEGPAPARIRVAFLRRVREERKFASPEALKQQIFRDVGRAESFFRRTAKLNLQP